MKYAKKLGQNFLIDNNIAKKIVNALYYKKNKKSLNVLEVGAGNGILTKYLLKSKLLLIELDTLYVNILRAKFPSLKERIINLDIIKFNPLHFNLTNFILLGNFPYSVSSQILFYLLKYKEFITECVGMFPKKVADRIVNKKKRKKNISVLTILIKTYFQTKYLFTVSNSVFSPQPKIKSSVIKIKRKKNISINYIILKKIVKTAFSQRRKQIKNSLNKILFDNEFLSNPIFNKRVEQLSIVDFTNISRQVIKFE
ncbi:16S rRNA (adenine(1518)-N(6)/adenine(1519)-N(6))-dimethyltransferase RsmA [Candidatus Karelsulcia muelleri]|uniref:16S rRNA (adenine(1518)-N(6)/adenine(1519)-N(6))- dimethyltransferase RsmA n=1 Tax=Candidatus Karelsulcia muelleri TaxID=336810 RepID=UPI00236450A9|nr:16S rRNA (adenine(1518)-N(6)/adenine(1519)-N(6))-dimethyltransferase RsmA [Candidatus Karelsulcia muelleri]WDE42149.1 16S rRNA (adenine(1518)-N(6)/adenine(1519)-N(6))-dimethyltransferase RsmA [Candidatus Karelsulcia muelleri]WDR79138.1 16S rRNA (adenine(1518)-N(6)/adenine(1519)-N(6))-dimethyltransferase RsmA [Candidatus Karelsulcia muelleri]